MKVIRWLIPALSIALGSALAGAADPAPTKNPAAQPAPNGKGKRQEVRQKIQMVRIWELSRVLGLDQKAAMGLFPTLSRFDERRAAAHKAVREAMQQLRKVSLGAKPDEAQIQTAMERLSVAKADVHRVESEELAEVRRLLTPTQQAKYVLFQQRFQKRIEGMIRKVREARAGKNLPLDE